MELLVLRGLPASGKSTYAKSLVENDKTYIRVNKDDIRRMIRGEASGKEGFTLKIRDFIIRQALSHGMNVISDDTNFHPKHIQKFTAIAKDCNATLRIKDMTTSVEECIRRDHSREHSVGAMVIKGMYNKYLKETE